MIGNWYIVKQIETKRNVSNEREPKRNEIEQFQNETKRIISKRSKTKRNQKKRFETTQSERNEIQQYQNEAKRYMRKAKSNETTHVYLRNHEFIIHNS